MPPRSKVVKLPRTVRARLDTLLVERGFGDYLGLSSWLESEGHQIGAGAIRRYGKKLERRLEQVRLATHQAEALMRSSPDDMGALASASLRQIQTALFEVLLASDEGDMKSLAQAARVVVEVARADRALHMDRQQILSDAGQAAQKAAARSGISPSTAEAIRAAIERGSS